MVLYFFRTILFFLYLGLVFFIGIIISLLRPKHPNNTYIISILLARPGFKILGLEVSIEGNEHRVGNTPSIFVANHQHNIDLLIAALIMKPKTVSIGKKSLGNIPIFGQFYKLSGNILVDRSNPKKAIRALKQVGQTIKEKEISVWIFPEGTRNTEAKLLPFKRGAFISAVEAEAPIIPVAIERYASKINLKKWKAGKIKITILPPIPTKGFGSKESQELCDSLPARIEAII